MGRKQKGGDIDTNEIELYVQKHENQPYYHRLISALQRHIESFDDEILNNLDTEDLQNYIDSWLQDYKKAKVRAEREQLRKVREGRRSLTASDDSAEEKSEKYRNKLRFQTSKNLQKIRDSLKQKLFEEEEDAETSSSMNSSSESLMGGSACIRHKRKIYTKKSRKTRRSRKSRKSHKTSKTKYASLRAYWNRRHKREEEQGLVDPKRTTKKYTSRPSPPYSANKYCGKRKKGNDGKWYISKKDISGICRWVKI